MENAEYYNKLGKEELSKPAHTACTLACEHFERAASLDPRSSEYPMHAGVACQMAIMRWLDHVGRGPLVSIAVFNSDTPFGRAIDKEHAVLETVTDENRKWLLDLANKAVTWYARALEINPSHHTARAWLVQFSRNIGALKFSLQQADQIIAEATSDLDSVNVAKGVKDYIVSSTSELRKYLTPAQAAEVPFPQGVNWPQGLGTNVSPRQLASVQEPAQPPEVQADTFARIWEIDVQEPAQPPEVETRSPPKACNFCEGEGVGGKPCPWCNNPKEDSGGVSILRLVYKDRQRLFLDQEMAGRCWKQNATAYKVIQDIARFWSSIVELHRDTIMLGWEDKPPVDLLASQIPRYFSGALAFPVPMDAIYQAAADWNSLGREAGITALRHSLEEVVGKYHRSHLAGLDWVTSPVGEKRKECLSSMFGVIDGDTDSQEIPDLTLTEDERREAEEQERERAATVLRQQPIMDQRRRNGKCIYCGESLGFLDRLASRSAHKGCASFSD